MTVRNIGCLFSLALVAAAADPPSKAPNPTVAKIVREVSEERIRTSLAKLESFGTRYILSEQDHPTRGIGAASRWLVEELKSYSPRLEVRTEPFQLKKGARQGMVLHDVELVNIVALLPGTLHKDRYVVIGAHYDSLNLVYPKLSDAERLADMVKRGMNEDEARRVMELFPSSESRGRPDYEATAKAEAPGVTDDGSGTAAVLELARVMSRYDFDKSILFVLFSGEEAGLEGSKPFAANAKQRGMQIEAMLNNDIIGSDVAGNGRRANRVVNVYSDANPESPSRALAEYVADAVGRYGVMQTDLIYRRDRFLRGGDHTPVAQAGYAAVRFTTPAENYKNQHSATDTLANTSVPYTTMVARANAAVLASLALAPAPPRVNYTYMSGPTKGRRVPMLSRGESQYDAVLRWEKNTEPDLAGYSVMMRSTTAPRWEKEIYVGNASSHRFPGLQIDEVVLGLKAIDTAGNASLVSQYLPHEGDIAPLKVDDKAPATR